MLTWAKHPILVPPTEAEVAAMDPKELVGLWNTYHEAIANAAKDPYRYGWSLPNWEKANEMFRKHRTLLLLGSNRSSKTEFGAKTSVKAALENNDSLIFCFSQNQETSVLVQQAAVFKYLPAELKKKATEETHYMSYSMQNGFAGNSVVFPNRSRIMFKTYTQFQQNQTILEGMELGAPDPKWINVGAWLDEYLMGMEMLDRLYLRLATRSGRLLLTFTPKDGETETVRYYRDGAVTLERRVAPLMETIHGKANYMVPYIQENEKRDTGIIYFHSIDNPWSGYQAIADQCRAKGDPNYTLTAAYGVPTKTMATKFPNFSVSLNVVAHDKIPRDKVTRYMVLDPAGRKNWFMCWIAVDATETWWVYREWPDVTSVGVWAEQRGGKWVTGEGAKGLGYGIKDYVDLITGMEGENGEQVFERLIDPRLGAAKYQTQNGASSIIEELNDAGLVFIPAPGLDIEDGLQALQTKMAWNPKKPLDAINRPRLYVSDRCQNIITALQEYTAEGGLEEAWKDPVDCYDADTEILTKNGWVRFDELPKDVEVGTMAKDGFLEWQMPTEYHARDFDGDLTCAESNSISFAVTPNHRMLVYPQKGNLRFRLAKDIYRQDSFPIATRGIRDCAAGAFELWPGKSVDEGDWAEFLGWYVAEGSATGTKGGKIQVPGRGYSVYISQSKTANPHKCEMIGALLDRLGFKYSYRNSSFCISCMKLWDLVFPLGNSYEKHLPEYVFHFSRSSIERMWNAMILGDGWKQGGEYTYATVSAGLAEQVTRIIQLLGLAQKSVYTRMLSNGRIVSTTPVIHVGTRKGRRATVTTKSKEMLVHKRPYSGMVYCVTVPNGTLVVRRNGKPLVCGNCLRYAAIDGIRFIDPKAFVSKRGTRGY